METMKKILLLILANHCLFLPFAFAQDTSSAKRSNKESFTLKNSEEKDEAMVWFTPPSGWHLADQSLLPTHVKVLVVGKGPSAFPPSMNLSSEPYKGSLKQYLKIVKNMNEARGYQWKDLGIIKTEAGNASLSQVDTKTQWGEVRLMHVILVKNGNVYILTASALKNDFSSFYQNFFAAMRSLRITTDVYDMIVNPEQRIQLKKAVDKLQSQWKTLIAERQKEDPAKATSEIQEDAFKSQTFQDSIWNPFIQMLNEKFGPLGKDWIILFQQKLEDELFNQKV